MSNTFAAHNPPTDPEALREYLLRTFREIANNITDLTEGRGLDVLHVEPTKPRIGMMVVADGSDWNPGLGEGLYLYTNFGWTYAFEGAVLRNLFNDNTILKADSDNTPIALTVPVQTLIGRITAGVITALTPAQVRTLLGVVTSTASFLTADETKLDGIESGAEVNSLNTESQVVTTSGTTHDFTGLPAAIKRIHLMFDGVSLSGTESLLVQLGDASSFETTGYVSSCVATDGVDPAGGGNISSTAGFIMINGAGGVGQTGHMTLTRITGNRWISSHHGRILNAFSAVGGGHKTLTGELTRIRLTRTGSDTFDAGAYNMFYEI